LGEADPDNREEAEGADQTANTAQGIPDGEYEGRSDSDERGNYGIVRLTVENEQITEVVYEEYSGDDVLKSREGGYTWEPSLEAFEELPQQLIQTQDVAKVDDYTGATGTTNKFRTAAKRALGQGMAPAEGEGAAENGGDMEAEDEVAAD
jgi:major membrane immunogen (membrane-anchored lipoprotein)